MTAIEPATKAFQVPPGYFWMVKLGRSVAVVELHRDTGTKKPPKSYDRLEFGLVLEDMNHVSYEWLRNRIAETTHKVYAKFVGQPEDYRQLEATAWALQGELGIRVEVERD